MRAAAVDIGTNTVRLLIADLEAGSMVDLVRHVEVVGLGRGVEHTGLLGETAMEAALATLRGYGAEIDRARPQGIRVVATSASRDAANSAGFLTRVAEVVRQTPEVISGEIEAGLAFRGAVWGAAGSGPHLVIDPGGGSTEFIFGHRTPESVRSVDIGSVRLTDRMLVDRPPSPPMLNQARQHVRDLFGDVPAAPPGTTVVGVAGTFTSLAAIHLDLVEYSREAVHGTSLMFDDLNALIGRLAGLTEKETAAIPSLDPRRAPVILAGAVVAAEAVARTGLGSVVVSETDLLEGIVLGLAEP